MTKNKATKKDKELQKVKKALAKLRKSMPKGYRDTLAEEFEISTSYIDQIFAGDKKRPDVIEHAIKMAELHKEDLDNQINKIKEL